MSGYNSNNRRIDLGLVLSYFFLIMFGWMNIYSAVFSEEHPMIFDLSQRYGMQFIWICISLIIGVLIIYIIDSKIYNVLSPAFYGVMLVLLAAVIFTGREVNGSRSWFFIGSLGLQPAEFSKITTSLFLSYQMSKYTFRMTNTKEAVKAALIVMIPILLIVMQNETGSALVYLGLIFVFFMEGLNGWVLIYFFFLIAMFVVTIAFSPLIAIICTFAAITVIRGIVNKKLGNVIVTLPALVIMAFLPSLMKLKFLSFMSVMKPEIWAIIISVPYIVAWLRYCLIYRVKTYRYLFISLVTALAFIMSVNFFFNKILQPHQKARIENLLGITDDPQGIGYNVHQSKIAIGSGGFLGKGFLHGTQTKYNFVPEQSTDFIFCTVGEEWGLWGSLIVIGVYLYLIIRILILSDKNPDDFARIYGYCVASIFFMHFFINIGMTMGLMPVIGIPLPFLSYGGSSMLSFTILLFIFIRLDMERQY